MRTVPLKVVELLALIKVHIYKLQCTLTDKTNTSHCFKRIFSRGKIYAGSIFFLSQVHGWDRLSQASGYHITLLLRSLGDKQMLAICLHFSQKNLLPVCQIQICLLSTVEAKSHSFFLGFLPAPNFKAAEYWYLNLTRRLYMCWWSSLFRKAVRHLV